MNNAIAVPGEGFEAKRVLDAVLVDVASGERVVASLVDGKWRRRPSLGGLGGGPMPGGPVRLGSKLFLPVIDATREPWELSAHVLGDGVWTQLGGPLNREAGNAQGVLRVAGGSVWASWQENLPRNDGLFATSMFAQRLAPIMGRARRIWAGTSIGPGSIEIVRGLRRNWILYMPRGKGRRALSVAVKPLR